MNVRIAASLLLLFSLVLPWTVVWGTNTMSGITSEFYVLEFPFMAYYVAVYGSETTTWWEDYQSAPKYLGVALVLIGGVLGLYGSARRKRAGFAEWGGISSVVGLAFFSGSSSAEIYIAVPLIQRYTSLPVGMFIPAVYWFLILFYPAETTGLARGTPEMFCGECGKGISAEFVFCPFCGTETKRVKCQVCGVKVYAESSFCPSCGSKIPRQNKKGSDVAANLELEPSVREG
jgi:hypothetical protein